MTNSHRSLVYCTSNPLAGLWSPESHLKHLYYGPGCVSEHLEKLLENLHQSSSSPTSEHVFIVTGNTLHNETPLIKQLESLLGERHASTYGAVKQHGHIDDVNEASKKLLSHVGSNGICTINTIISVGGGSPIDTAKALSYRFNELDGHFLTHITIPTTLSAAECTAGGGYTNADGIKVGFMCPGMGISAIFYDAKFTMFTPQRLLLSTGIRAVDHAVETAYHPNSSEMPWKALACWALGVLFECLPKCASMGSTGSGQAPTARLDVLTRLQLAAFASSGLRGSNFGGGMGLSHSLGHALGSPYGIPHGDTSCLTLGPVVRLIATRDKNACQQISRVLLPAIGERGSGDCLEDSKRFASRLESLVTMLGLGNTSLVNWKVSLDQIPIIVQRTVKGSSDESFVTAVTHLVEDLFRPVGG